MKKNLRGCLVFVFLFLVSSSATSVTVNAAGPGPTPSPTPTPTQPSFVDYAVNASAGPGGTISPSGVFFAYPGSSFTFTITPNTGYQISDISDNGVSKGAQQTYELSDVQTNHQIIATFSKITTTGKNQTYYVAPNGDDSNPGTVNEPWRTIQHAADTVAAGDTVLIRNGVYHEQIIISNGGNATSGYIVFSAYPGETPVIDGTGVSTGNNGFVIETSYIKISGLEIRNWPDNGICSWSAGYLEISDSKIHDAGGGVSFYDGSHDFSVNQVEVYRTDGGFDASPAEGADCYNGVINDCDVHNALDPDQAPDGFAIGHGGEHNFVFNRCEVYQFFDGFDISGHDVQINSCSSHDNSNTGYKIWDNNVTLTNCLGYNNEENNLQLPWNNKQGTVTLRNCDLVGKAEMQNIWIQNESHGLRMYNCILACGTNVGLDFEHLGAGTYQGDYNIFHSNNPDRVVVIRDQDLEFSLDVIAAGNWTQYSGQDQHSIVCTDPASQLFKNLSSWDFHIKQGSIAVDAGTSTDAPQVDYDGSTRPQGEGYDIGAYEYGQSLNQSTPTPSLTPTSSPEAQKLALPLGFTVLLTAAIVVVGAVAVIFLIKKRWSRLSPPPQPSP